MDIFSKLIPAKTVTFGIWVNTSLSPCVLVLANRSYIASNGYWITSELNCTLKKKIDHICNETEVRVESTFMEMSVAVGGEFWKNSGKC